jgi:hypothetical protein
MDFEIVDDVTDVETIAVGKAIRELHRLYGRPVEEDEERRSHSS